MGRGRGGKKVRLVIDKAEQRGGTGRIEGGGGGGKGGGVRREVNENRDWKKREMG